MNVIHKLSVRPTEDQRRELQSLGVVLPAGIALPGGGAPYVVFEIEESHPRWDAIERLVQEWGVGDIVSTRFSAREVSAAQWLQVVPDWHHGYPQPKELDFGYRRATYDLADWCDQCGIGMAQSAPFQMTGEPKWGRRGILQLNWVFDEYFVTPEVWAAVFKPYGIASRPVMSTKGGELRTVIQLVVEEEVGISAKALIRETCMTCDRPKFEPHTRGFFPTLLTEPTRSIVKTVEWFGSGAAAHKRVLVSQELARAMTLTKLRGASFWPVSVDSVELD